MMNASPTQPKLPAHVVRRIAVAADVDPRAVNNYLAGRPGKASVRERVARALAKLAAEPAAAVRP